MSDPTTASRRAGPGDQLTMTCPICAAPRLVDRPVLSADRLNEIHALESFRPGLRHEILSVFTDSAETSLERCRQALAEGQRDVLIQAAHRLLGSASSVGAEQLASLAAQTEAGAAAACEEHTLRALLEQLQRAVDEALSAYRQWLAT